ncbi:MAG TPA: zinc finger CCCH domain-containing protein [Legionellaceae bacterium]|nr:zinc finger CCCH domain-containing protein [Legionellaceae bacterium]
MSTRSRAAASSKVIVKRERDVSFSSQVDSAATDVAAAATSNKRLRTSAATLATEQAAEIQSRQDAKKVKEATLKSRHAEFSKYATIVLWSWGKDYKGWPMPNVKDANPQNRERIIDLLVKDKNVELPTSEEEAAEVWRKNDPNAKEGMSIPMLKDEPLPIPSLHHQSTHITSSQSTGTLAKGNENHMHNMYDDDEKTDSEDENDGQRERQPSGRVDSKMEGFMKQQMEEFQKNLLSALSKAQPNSSASSSSSAAAAANSGSGGQCGFCKKQNSVVDSVCRACNTRSDRAVDSEDNKFLRLMKMKELASGEMVAAAATTTAAAAATSTGQSTTQTATSSSTAVGSTAAATSSTSTLSKRDREFARLVAEGAPLSRFMNKDPISTPQAFERIASGFRGRDYVKPSDQQIALVQSGRMRKIGHALPRTVKEVNAPGAAMRERAEGGLLFSNNGQVITQLDIIEAPSVNSLNDLLLAFCSVIAPSLIANHIPALLDWISLIRSVTLIDKMHGWKHAIQYLHTVLERAVSHDQEFASFDSTFMHECMMNLAATGSAATIGGGTPTSTHGQSTTGGTAGRRNGSGGNGRGGVAGSCHEWNRTGVCPFNPNCRFQHVCNVCNSTEHHGATHHSHAAGASGTTGAAAGGNKTGTTMQRRGGNQRWNNNNNNRNGGGVNSGSNGSSSIPPSSTTQQ